MLEKHAPVTAKRFIKLAEDKVWVGGSYYRFVISYFFTTPLVGKVFSLCHSHFLFRSEPSFVLQGGLWGKKEYELPSLDLEYKYVAFYILLYSQE